MADIRPMNFGEILDGSLMIYRRHFGLFLQLAVVALTLPVLLLVYFGVRFLAGFATRTPDFRALAILIPVVILYYLGSLVLTTGTVRIISDSYLGRTPRLQDALALGVSKIWSLAAVGLGKVIVLCLIAVVAGVLVALLAAVAKGLGALGGFLIIGVIVAGIWFDIFVACGYGLTTPVVVLEDLSSGFDAFGRSWALTRSFKGKVLGLAVVTILLTNTLPSLVFRGLGSVALPSIPALGVALTALGYILPLILAPVFAAVITLMYPP